MYLLPTYRHGKDLPNSIELKWRRRTPHRYLTYWNILQKFYFKILFNLCANFSKFHGLFVLRYHH